MGKMRYSLKLLSEAAKAAGRILAGLALLNYRVCLIALKIGMLLQAGLAILRVAGGFQRWMCAPLGLAAYGVCLIVRTRRLTGLPGSVGELIVTGPFAVVRHPMYSGWCLAALGAAWIDNSRAAWALAAVQVIFMLSVSCAEDEENAQVFGDAYIRYSKSVPLTGVVMGLARCLIRRTGLRNRGCGTINGCGGRENGLPREMGE